MSEFSADRFITLCSSGLSPSVPAPPVLPGVIFRADRGEVLQCLFVNYAAPSVEAWLSFFSRGGKKKKKKTQMCSVEPFKHI